MDTGFHITTYWQSLDLMQAGLDRDTCDFVYQRNYKMVAVESERGDVVYYEPELMDGYFPRLRKDIDEFNTDLVPAWSMGRLWQLMYESNVTYDYSTNECVEKVIESLVHTVGRLAKHKQIKNDELRRKDK